MPIAVAFKNYVQGIFGSKKPPAAGEKSRWQRVGRLKNCEMNLAS